MRWIVTDIAICYFIIFEDGRKDKVDKSGQIFL